MSYQSYQSTLRHGLIVGLIAYATVAAFYSGLDVLAARGPLFTVDMLGKAVFRELRDPAVLLFPRELDLFAILLYNGLHLAVALSIGLLTTALVGHAKQHPGRASLILTALVAGGVVTVAAVVSLARPMRPVLPWWSVGVANAWSAGLAGVYLLLQWSNSRLHVRRSDATPPSNVVA